MAPSADVGAPVNLLEYLQSKTQVDVDSLDIQVSNELGPFVDCTSNQLDAYTELLNPQHAGLLKKAVALAKELRRDYPSVTLEELAFEISMVSLAQTIVPKITGAILVMVNPLYAYSTPKVIDNGQRLYRLCKYLQPNFDMSRLIIKVPSTWEGLQACRKLKGLGVQTLGTTMFSLEQAILAGEAGCVYVSPFLFEMKSQLDETHIDHYPIFDVCVNAQRYYQKHSVPTRVKACGAITVEQILQLAGVSAFTAAKDQLRELASMKEPAAQVAARSVFNREELTNGHHPEVLAERKFIDDEAGYRLAFSRSDDGRGQMKTTQALNIFSEYQVKGEALMRDSDLTTIG